MSDLGEIILTFIFVAVFLIAFAWPLWISIDALVYIFS